MTKFKKKINNYYIKLVIQYYLNIKNNLCFRIIKVNSIIYYSRKVQYLHTFKKL